jgi:hypothetical protein
MRTDKNRNPLHRWYVTGFAESAGSFTYNRSGGQLTLVFAVRLPASDRALLRDLQRFLGGIGRIYSTAPAEARVPRGACFFRVNRTRELLRVVEHFDACPLRGGKRNAYRIWREMVFLRAAHHGSRPPEELWDLAEKLSRLTRRKRPAHPVEGRPRPA